eukprot:PhM_4_TR13580/c0_g1_i1/m.13015
MHTRSTVPRDAAVLFPRDIADYHAGYPRKKDLPTKTKNIDFYLNKIPSVPEGDFIDVIHKEWFGDYDRLEVHHGYIQWLFPIQEHGLNASAQDLQRHEIEKMSRNAHVRQRLVKSYVLMLDFYGFVLADAKTGAVALSDAWQERFDNLVRHPHNFLRITRILKCLGELGFEHYKAPWLEALIHECFAVGTLARVSDSLQSYWVNTVRDTAVRTRLHALIAQKEMDLQREVTMLEDDEPPKRRKTASNSKVAAAPKPTTTTTSDIMMLPRTMLGVTAYFHPSMPGDKQAVYARWVVAYCGTVSPTLGKSVTHMIVDTDALTEAERRQIQPPRGCFVVDSDWVLLSHKKRTKLAESAFFL